MVNDKLNLKLILKNNKLTVLAVVRVAEVAVPLFSYLTMIKVNKEASVFVVFFQLRLHESPKSIAQKRPLQWPLTRIRYAL